MDYCNIVFGFYLKDGRAFVDIEDKSTECDAVELSEKLENNGFDEVLIKEISETDGEHDKNISVIKDIVAKTDIRILLGGNIKRLEDVKKYLYAGAKMAVLDGNNDVNREMITEASERFGSDKVAVSVRGSVGDDEFFEACRQVGDMGADLVITDKTVSTDNLKMFENMGTSVLMTNKAIKVEDIVRYAGSMNLYGIVADSLVKDINDVMYVKQNLLKQGVKVNCFESSMSFKEFKTDDKGLVSVVVQEYKNDTVLMVAYMNEESFNETIRTGRMTYFSRSRQSLWVKGETSGHFQYVKALYVDCDKDTILAKVKQDGVACHTGSYSCFFNQLVKKEYDETNPLKVFQDVFDVINDRKVNPKEGSYTNYLFDKGIDKILKKVGEEAAEVIIASKDEDSQEVVYEISDLLYHLMVLMAEKGIGWDEVTKELARR